MAVPPGHAEAEARGHDGLGVHVSIAGGLPQALLRGRALGCAAVQIFLKSQLRWAGRRPDPAEVAAFRRLRAVTGGGAPRRQPGRGARGDPGAGAAPRANGRVPGHLPALAAGYDIRTRSGLAATLSPFDQAVSLEHVVAFHVNDAKAPLGSGLDRHEHIGRGWIGLVAFRALLTDRRVGGRPMVLETPESGDGDARNLALLRALSHGGAGRGPARRGRVDA